MRRRHVLWTLFAPVFFAACMRSLFVAKAGSGSGTITSVPPAIDCGTQCTARADEGATFTLTATPDRGSTFTGWSSACTGTGNCSVTLSGDRTVVAAFRMPALALGAYHTCAMSADGAVRCWGRNTDGQAGQPPVGAPIIATAPLFPGVLSPTPVTVGSAIAIATGGYHTCALLQNGTVSCWGLNDEAQLAGVAPTLCDLSSVLYPVSCGTATPTAVGGITTATAIAAGGYHTCALLSNGTVSCWGRFQEGQLGSGASPTSYGPLPVAGISTAVAISAGAYHTCALLADGTVRCWGLNGNGQIGDGTNRTAYSPVTVPGLGRVKAIAAANGGGVQAGTQLGGYHTCALLSNGMVNCWGHNNDGELGNASNQDSSLPVPVTGITNAIAIAAGGYHTCALLSAATPGNIQCWGHNGDGELGSGSTTASNRPVTVAAPFTATAIAAGGFHTCAMSSIGPPGLIQCWGNNGDGQLGNLLQTPSSRPGPVFGF